MTHARRRIHVLLFSLAALLSAGCTITYRGERPKDGLQQLSPTSGEKKSVRLVVKEQLGLPEVYKKSAIAVFKDSKLFSKVDENGPADIDVTVQMRIDHSENGALFVLACLTLLTPFPVAWDEVTVETKVCGVGQQEKTYRSTETLSTGIMAVLPAYIVRAFVGQPELQFWHALIELNRSNLVRARADGVL
jgi:hypothetical protein